jgi:hypothetical protein
MATRFEDTISLRKAVWDELIKPSGKIPNWSQSEFHPRMALSSGSRIFESKGAGESEIDAVKRALENPISKFSVNASLTLRLAMQRLLKIDEQESNIKTFERKKWGG